MVCRVRDRTLKMMKVNMVDRIDIVFFIMKLAKKKENE